MSNNIRDAQTERLKKIIQEQKEKVEKNKTDDIDFVVGLWMDGDYQVDMVQYRSHLLGPRLRFKTIARALEALALEYEDIRERMNGELADEWLLLSMFDRYKDQVESFEDFVATIMHDELESDLLSEMVNSITKDLGLGVFLTEVPTVSWCLSSSKEKAEDLRVRDKMYLAKIHSVLDDGSLNLIDDVDLGYCPTPESLREAIEKHIPIKGATYALDHAHLADWIGVPTVGLSETVVYTIDQK